MTVGRICQREVDTADQHETVKTVAQRMGQRNVGTLIVLDAEEQPVGILTDRDLALRVIGAGLDPLTTPVREVMTTSMQTVFEGMVIEDALSLMRNQAIRRLPVVGKTGRLIGILSLDDILSLLAEELGDVGRLIAKEAPRALARS